MYVAPRADVRFGDIFEAPCLYDVHLQGDAARLARGEFPKAAPLSGDFYTEPSDKLRLNGEVIRAHGRSGREVQGREHRAGHDLPGRAVLLSDDCHVPTAYGHRRDRSQARGRLLFAIVIPASGDEIREVARSANFGRFALRAHELLTEGGIAELRRTFLVRRSSATRASMTQDACCSSVDGTPMPAAVDPRRRCRTPRGSGGCSPANRRPPLSSSRPSSASGTRSTWRGTSRDAPCVRPQMPSRRVSRPMPSSHRSWRTCRVCPFWPARRPACWARSTPGQALARALQPPALARPAEAVGGEPQSVCERRAPRRAARRSASRAQRVEHLLDLLGADVGRAERQLPRSRPCARPVLRFIHPS